MEAERQVMPTVLPDGERFVVNPSRAAAQFRRLPLSVRDILRLCDGIRTREAIYADSPLSVDQTEQVLQRLTALGVVSLRGANEPPPAAPPPPAAQPPVGRAQRTVEPAQPLVERPHLAVEPAQPLVERPHLAVEPAPLVELPAPLVEPPQPAVEPSQPAVEPPQPAVEPPQPFAERPAPTAARAPAEPPPSVHEVPQLPAPPLGFTDEEELFFASSIEHLIEME